MTNESQWGQIVERYAMEMMKRDVRTVVDVHWGGGPDEDESGWLGFVRRDGKEDVL